MDNLALSQGGSFAFASGALGNGTTAGTIKTTAIVPFTVDGIFYTKAITDNIPFTLALTPSYGVVVNGSFTGGPFTVGAVSGSTRLYGVYMDKAGVVSYLPGPLIDTAVILSPGSTAGLQFPANRKGRVCIGMVRIAATAGTSFIPGVTALNAAGITTTYLNLSAIPAEPLLA